MRGIYSRDCHCKPSEDHDSNRDQGSDHGILAARSIFFFVGVQRAIKGCSLDICLNG